MKQITFLLLAILTFVNAKAQGLDNFLPALNATVEHIKYTKAEDDFQDLEGIGKLLHGKKVIGLGEATHGTREHFVFKDRMIRYLILNHNLKRIAFESEMAGSDRINEYVVNPNDQSDLKKILRESGMYDVFISTELMEMIFWIKDYNKDKPSHEKVHFEGMDMQHPSRIANKILHTPKLMSLLNAAEKKSLKQFAELFEANGFALVPNELLKNIASVSKTLATGIKHLSDRDSVSFYKQDNALLSQSIKMRNKSLYFQSYLRDKFMAKNVAWIADQTPDNHKIAAWAHNGHISKGLYSKYRAMGNWLQKRYRSKYYALALLAGEGSARLSDAEGKIQGLSKVTLPPLSNLNSLEYLFAQAKYENFFFNVQKAGKSDDFKGFFDRDLYIRTIGSQLIPPIDIKVRLRNSHDGLIFFRNTSAATTPPSKHQ